MEGMKLVEVVDSGKLREIGEMSIYDQNIFFKILDHYEKQYF